MSSANNNTNTNNRANWLPSVIACLDHCVHILYKLLMFLMLLLLNIYCLTGLHILAIHTHTHTHSYRLAIAKTTSLVWLLLALLALFCCLCCFIDLIIQSDDSQLTTFFLSLSLSLVLTLLVWGHNLSVYLI